MVELNEVIPLLEKVVKPEQKDHTISLDTRFVEDLALDSLGSISLMFLCEERFGVPMNEHADVLANLNTVGKVIDFVNQLQHK